MHFHVLHNSDMSGIKSSTDGKLTEGDSSRNMGQIGKADDMTLARNETKKLDIGLNL